MTIRELLEWAVSIITAAVNSIGTATDNVAKAFQRGEFLDLTIWDFILGGLVWSLGMIMAAIAA